jgi:hypothetical protein
MYALGRHVFLCVCGRDFVLLDLIRDKYLALAVTDASGLSALVRGWPVASLPPSHSATPEESASLAEALLEKGLLTVDLATGKDATPIALPKPIDEITADMHERHALRPGAAASFIGACITGRFLRQRRSIEHIVERVRRRKEKAGFVAQEFDVARARNLIATFGSMRSLFFSTRNLCLLESIVLLELFARYDLFPTWVFGVHVRPFAAHCWLQYEDLVLNDTIDNVTRYTPIMTV